jgi:histidinol-phosphate aminotransferase
VSVVAQAGAMAALEVKDELLASVPEVVSERERVRDALLGMGYTVPPTQSNFVWLALGDRTAAFAAHHMDHKLIVRPFATDGVRVTVSSPQENDLLLAAAAAFAGN